MTEWFASYNSVEQLFLLGWHRRWNHSGLQTHSHGRWPRPSRWPGRATSTATPDFQALTIQGISSFFTMFGVVGFTLYHNAALGVVLALARCGGRRRASRCGSSSKIFRSMMRLQSSGTVSLFAAVGSEGSVYLTVGKDGGRVQINFANRLREFEAVSADGSTLPTGTRDSSAERDGQHAGRRAGRAADSVVS